MSLRRLLRILTGVAFVAWSAVLCVVWWQTADRTGQVLIMIGFTLVAATGWFGALAAVAGNATGTLFGLFGALAWWGLRYLGRVGDGFADWFVQAQDLWGAGLIVTVILAKLLPWTGRERPAGPTDRQIRETQEWGVPGRSDAALPYGTDNAAVGRLADRTVAEQLNDLVRQQSARLIHGLRFTDAGPIDVDHALLVGDRLALIDVRAWQPGIYAWGGPWHLLYYGERFRGGHDEIATAAAVCRGRLGHGVQVRSWIVVAPVGEADQHVYVLDNTDAPDGVTLCRADDLEAVSAWLAEGSDELDPERVRALLGAHQLHPAAQPQEPAEVEDRTPVLAALRGARRLHPRDHPAR